MHLTVVSPFPPTITGIGQYGFHITRAIEKSGLFSRITVLAGAKAGSDHTPVLNHAEIDYCWQPDDLKTRKIILSRLKHLKPDLVWFNLGASVFGKSPLANLSAMFTPMLARKMGLPTIVTLHELVELADLRALNAPGGFLAPLGARLLTEVATQADLVCLTMQHYVDWLSARHINCTHIPIGSYHEPELLEETDEQELLFFTTLAPFKGLEILLEAFKELKLEFPNLRLSIAGAEHTRFPNYSNDLRKKCDASNNIRWLGQVPEEQVKELFQSAQIVVLPYTASTGSSSVLYQSATWGRAIVASDLNEHKYLAKENNLQIQFFENGNVQSLKNSLRELLKNRELRKQQTAHNLNAIQKLTPSETCRHYIQAFNHALETCSSQKRIIVPHKEMKLS
ncbi:glycosyltransferase [Candidatus Villigracilis affinis]|uniref:glycosyltransferase n=1 Tax=Candidatus Villigracilis affinis TaxID=3140682 RepID=UPI002A227F55|nr:glycosyltransferase [Anaerolineales bacterium]